jgi:hypothetical protein
MKTTMHSATAGSAPAAAVGSYSKALKVSKAKGVLPGCAL